MSDPEGEYTQMAIANLLPKTLALVREREALSEFRRWDRWVTHGNRSIEVADLFRRDSPSRS